MKTQDLLTRSFLTSVLLWVAVSIFGSTEGGFALSNLMFIISTILYFVTAIYIVFLSDTITEYSGKFGIFSVALFGSFAACGIFGHLYSDDFLSLMWKVSIAGCFFSFFIAAACLIWKV